MRGAVSPGSIARSRLSSWVAAEAAASCGFPFHDEGARNDFTSRLARVREQGEAMIDSVDGERLVGTSEAIRRIEQQVDAAAGTDAKVLITGESGVGKEVIARLVHQRSDRRLARLLTINCAGLPDGLLESELFGHVRGAFTGAYRDKTGLLELGHRGTIFLDEVGEMSLRMQAVLLRFLETGEIHRVGADRAQTRADVRVISATNRNLPERIAKHEFREDLYFRLNVINVTMPPLRERPEDIAPLLEYFLARYCQRAQIPVPQLAPEALERLARYHWPGNVRELKNVVQRLTLIRGTSIIRLVDLPSEIAPPPAAAGVDCPRQRADALFHKITREHETFWSAVYEPFMARDLTRDDVRAVVKLGLEQANGSYRDLVALFRMPATDYKRFLNFLRTYECQRPDIRFEPIKMPDARVSGIDRPWDRSRRSLTAS